MIISPGAKLCPIFLLRVGDFDQDINPFLFLQSLAPLSFSFVFSEFWVRSVQWPNPLLIEFRRFAAATATASATAAQIRSSWVSAS